MRTLAAAVALAALGIAPLALAEGDSDTPADVAAQRTLRERNADDAAQARMGGIRECWNMNTREFNQVEEGRPQPELDYRRCRLAIERPDYRTQRAAPYAYGQRYRGPSPDPRGPMECWNPRAWHFEGVRPGEIQDDLDFSRCRIRR